MSFWEWLAVIDVACQLVILCLLICILIRW
jgi:hypothetical protein